MSINQSKVYVKIGTAELTLEGPDELVSDQIQQFFGKKEFPEITDYKKNINEQTTELPEAKPPQSPRLTAHQKILDRLGDDFQNWLDNLSYYASKRDKILVATYYNQLKDSSQKFYIKGVISTLKKYGQLVPRVSNFIDTFEIQKLIYKVDDIDHHNNAYRFTNEGIEHITNLYSFKVRTIKVEV